MSNIKYNLFDIESICESLTSQASDDKCTIEKLKNDMNSLVNDSILDNPTYAYLSARDYTDTIMMPLVNEYDNACTSLIDTARNIRSKYSELCFNEDLDLLKLEMEKSQNISTFDNINNYLDYLCQRNPGLNNKIIDYRDQYKNTHEKSINQIQLKIDNMQEFDKYCSTILTPVIDNYQQLKDTVDEKPLYDSSEKQEEVPIFSVDFEISQLLTGWQDILEVILKRLAKSSIKSSGTWATALGKWLDNVVSGASGFFSKAIKSLPVIGAIVTAFENFFEYGGWSNWRAVLSGLCVDLFVDFVIFSPKVVGFIAGLSSFTTPLGVILVGGLIVEFLLNSVECKGKTIKEHIMGFVDCIIFGYPSTSTN